MRTPLLFLFIFPSLFVTAQPKQPDWVKRQDAKAN